MRSMKPCEIYGVEARSSEAITGFRSMCRPDDYSRRCRARLVKRKLVCHPNRRFGSPPKLPKAPAVIRMSPLFVRAPVCRAQLCHIH